MVIQSPNQGKRMQPQNQVWRDTMLISILVKESIFNFYFYADSYSRNFILKVLRYIVGHKVTHFTLFKHSCHQKSCVTVIEREGCGKLLDFDIGTRVSFFQESIFLETRIHSSRMRTARFSSHLSCTRAPPPLPVMHSPCHTCLPYHACMPLPCMPSCHTCSDTYAPCHAHPLPHMPPPAMHTPSGQND